MEFAIAASLCWVRCFRRRQGKRGHTDPVGHQETSKLRRFLLGHPCHDMISSSRRVREMKSARSTTVLLQWLAWSPSGLIGSCFFSCFLTTSAQDFYGFSHLLPAIAPRDPPLPPQELSFHSNVYFSCPCLRSWRLSPQKLVTIECRLRHAIHKSLQTANQTLVTLSCAWHVDF